MKSKSTLCAAAVAAVLAMAAMTGCGSQQATQTSSSSESASASASASEAKSQDQIFAELKESLSNVPAYESVTITENDTAWTDDGTGETIESTTVYKFDESGDQPKTSVVYKLEDIELQYYSDGDDAVCVTDGPVYSGTVDQFDLSYAAGSSVYLEDTIGDLDKLVECAVSATQDDINGVTGYEITLDPEKYIESDEMLKLSADAGDPIQEAYLTVGFDKDGRIVWMTKTSVFTKMTSIKMLDLGDFDSTVIDPMPEATNTFEEMEADMQEKFDALDEELALDDEPESAADSEDAAEAK